MSKAKYLVFSFLFTFIFAGCTTTSKNVEAPLKVENEVNSKQLFSENDNWLPINKNTDFKNAKNDKVVK